MVKEGDIAMRKIIKVKDMIEELSKFNPEAEMIAESPYRDQFKIYSVEESDDKTVVWIYA